MYVIGGINAQNHQMMSICQKFDVRNLKWIEMPEMVHPRFAPGIFISTNNNLYSFGGQHDSIEKLNLNKRTNIWKLVEVEIPMDLGLGLQLFPMS